MHFLKSVFASPQSDCSIPCYYLHCLHASITILQFSTISAYLLSRYTEFEYLQDQWIVFFMFLIKLFCLWIVFLLTNVEKKENIHMN